VQNLIAQLLKSHDEGRLNRRQLIQSLAVLAAGGSAASVPAAAADTPYKATMLHHLSLTVPDYAKSRDFYANVFGMKITNDEGNRCQLASGNCMMVVRGGNVTTPMVDHFGIAVEGFNANNKEAVVADLKRRGLNPSTGTKELGISIKDPGGFRIQVERGSK
jgi:catechol 2,3-dioxygenase-like lactoylglutathione lyase family enzyme